VATAQQHLGVSDLVQVITSHPMPDGKSLGELIEFYQKNKDKTPVSSRPT
jgi:hypothetical protein